MIRKNRGNRRFQNYTKSKRKAKILSYTSSYDVKGSLNRLSKAKIHCSCPMCTSKTNSRYIRSKGPVSEYTYISDRGDVVHIQRTLRPSVTNHKMSKNWKPSDIRKIDSLKECFLDYLYDAVRSGRHTLLCRSSVVC